MLSLLPNLLCSLVMKFSDPKCTFLVGKILGAAGVHLFILGLLARVYLLDLTQMVEGDK